MHCHLPSGRGSHPPDQRIDLFQGGIRFRTQRAVRMFDMIERCQLHRYEAQPLEAYGSPGTPSRSGLLVSQLACNREAGLELAYRFERCERRHDAGPRPSSPARWRHTSSPMPGQHWWKGISQQQSTGLRPLDTPTSGCATRSSPDRAYARADDIQLIQFMFVRTRAGQADSGRFPTLPGAAMRR